MSIGLMVEILDCYHGPHPRKLWLLAWAEKVGNGDGSRAGYCSRAVLANRLGVSQTRVSHIARELVAEGVLRRLGGGVWKQSAVYELLSLARLPDTPQGDPRAHPTQGDPRAHPTDAAQGDPRTHPTDAPQGASDEHLQDDPERTHRVTPERTRRVTPERTPTLINPQRTPDTSAQIEGEPCAVISPHLAVGGAAAAGRDDGQPHDSEAERRRQQDELTEWMRGQAEPGDEFWVRDEPADKRDDEGMFTDDCPF